MTELRVWTGRQTAGHSTMPQSVAISRAEAHAQALHTTICTHNTQLYSDAYSTMYIPLREIMPAVSKHMVVNEHAGLCMPKHMVCLGTCAIFLCIAIFKTYYKPPINKPSNIIILFLM